ncbi:MAG: hypothetical protein R3C53_26300 [Pirellulaceae bacterium]
MSIRTIGLGLLLATLFSLPSQAAVVGFIGQLDTKILGAAGTGVFGGRRHQRPIWQFGLQFNGHIDVTDITGIITGGQFLNMQAVRTS